MIVFSLDVYAQGSRKQFLLDRDQRSPLPRDDGDEPTSTTVAALAYERYHTHDDDDGPAEGAGGDDDEGISAAKSELLMLVILFAAIAATAVGVAAFVGVRKYKRASHFGLSMKAENGLPLFGAYLQLNQ